MIQLSTKLRTKQLHSFYTDAVCSVAPFVYHSPRIVLTRDLLSASYCYQIGDSFSTNIRIGIVGVLRSVSYYRVRVPTGLTKISGFVVFVESR